MLNRNVTAAAISTNTGNSLVLKKRTLTRGMIGKFKLNLSMKRSSREVMK